MEHSIRFSGELHYLYRWSLSKENWSVAQRGTNRHSYNDFYLIPKERYSVEPPEPKTQYVEIPGANGGLDISKSLTGYILYDYREGSFEFIVDNSRPRWEVLWREMTSYFHGKELYMMLEDDPQWIYHGRFSISKYDASDKSYSTIRISYKLDPYKIFALYDLDNYAINWEGRTPVSGIKQSWYFDALDLIDGKISDFSIDNREGITIDSPYYVRIDSSLLKCGERPVVPTIKINQYGDERLWLNVRNSTLGFDHEIELKPQDGSDSKNFTFYDRRIIFINLNMYGDVHLSDNDTTVYAKGDGVLKFYYDVGVL